MGRMVTTENIISLIRTIPISVHKGQHALLLADNSAESIALYGFFLKNNVPLILLNASMRDEQVQEYMDEYRPQWFVYPKNRNLPQYSGGQTECSENRKRYQCYETACEWNGYVIASRGNAGFELTYHWLEDLALLIPTSGSTGGRRLVMLTKANLAANAKSIAESLRMDCTERSAVLMPVSYSYGLSVVNSTIYAGGRLLIPETDIFHKECWDYLEENRVTAISGVPYAYEWYRKLHVFDRTFEALRLMTTAGGAMSRSMKEYLLQEAERRNVDLAVMYGQTEATARISSFFLNEHPDKIDSVGTVIPGGKLTISRADENGCGEIVYEGKNVFLGYAHSLNQLFITEQESYKYTVLRYTGDAGYIDGDGYLYITGRMNRYAKICGQRVGLDELQTEIGKMFGQKVAAVMTADGEREMIGIFGTKEPDAAWERRVLQRYPILRGSVKYIQIEELPRTMNGKLDYKKLQEYI